MLFAMFALCRTPTIQKAPRSARGLWGEGASFFSTFRQIALPSPCVLDPQHWLTIVTHVLSNNLAMLGRILSRLTGYVRRNDLKSCCDRRRARVRECNWFIYFMTRMQSKCEICYCNAAPERDREPLLDEGGGKVVPCMWRALAILPNLPRTLISRSLKWNLPQHPAGSAPNRFIYSHCKRRLLFNGAVE